MLARFDQRSFSLPAERNQRCSTCGRPLVVLPDDHRGGTCFDCLSFGVTPDRRCADCGTRWSADIEDDSCPRCGAEIPLT